MKRLSDIAISRPVFAWMIMFGLIVFGAVSLGRLGVSYLPDVDFPVLSVRVSWDGAAPEIMEAEIVDRLERRLITVEGLTEMRSSVRQGSASIGLDFDIDRKVDSALQEVQAAISRVELPLGVEPPVIRKNNTDDDPILWLAVGGDMELPELFAYADQQIIDRLQLLPGVGEVFFGGDMERNLRIWIDNQKLREYQLTVPDVRRAIAENHNEGAAGYLENSDEERNLRVFGEALSIRDFEEIRITRRGGQPIFFSDIRLKDVARVEDGLNDHQRITRATGEDGLSIGVRKQIGANTVAVGKAVKAELEKIQKDLPEGLTAQVSFDRTVYIEEAVEETQFTLLLSALLTALVCWLFLGNLSSTLNVVLSIPTSIVGTFLIMYFMGFTLNLFTLLALSLAIGIVVDDNIMILENIVRHYDMGKDRVKAARDGARQILFAAIAASVAVIAIFLPVAFMDGVIGRFFFQFGVTITGAVALSLVDAVTLTPMRASRLLRRDQRTPRVVQATMWFVGFAGRGYERALALALSHRWKTLGLGTLFFAVSLLLFTGTGLKIGDTEIPPPISKEFTPTQDQSQFGMRLRTPLGYSLPHTARKTREVETFLLERPEVRKYVALIGGFGGGQASTAYIFVSMVSPSERALSQHAFMDEVRAHIKSVAEVEGFLFDFNDSGLNPRRGSPVEFTIRGGEWSTLAATSRRIVERMQQEAKLFLDPDQDYREGMPEAQIIPDREQASLRGVTMESLVNTIGPAMGGAREGRFTNDGRRYDIRVRLEGEYWSEVDDLRKLQIRNIYGELIPFTDVARVEVKPVVQELTRMDRQRAITISANLPDDVGQAEAMARAEAIAREEIPEGYSFRPGGGAQGFNQAFNSLYFALWLGVLVAYMVLAAQFNSFLHPLAVLLALPFSVSGALIALYVAGQTVNLYSLIGVILLMGLAKKNSILLIEFANQQREREGADVRSALLEAARVRLRPILMTSLSAIAAALPPALAIGPGAESRIPMAIAVIGGMAVSTAFTLFMAPAAYSLLAPLERHRRNVGDDAR